MIRRLTLVVLLLGQAMLALAQHDSVKYDYNWVFGYAAEADHPDFGTNHLSFESETLSIVDGPESLFDCLETNVAISDAAGNLLFYTNGAYIYDASHTFMMGGDTLSPSQYTDDKYNTGHFISQGVLALPDPGNEQIWHLIHNYAGWGMNVPGVVAPEIFHTTVNMSLNGGLGATEILNEVMLDESEYATSNKTACRHANGRDWWIMIAEAYSNVYHTFLLDPMGLNYQGGTQYGDTVWTGLGQAKFSNDGNHFVRYNAISSEEGSYLDVYDFDRSTGALSNQRRVHTTKSGSGGLSISPNSRYAYTSVYDEVHQYDLWADDLEASRVVVAVYDGFVSHLGFPTRFFSSQLAPDGKIYITTTNTNTYWHVIHEPDSAGLACNLDQHAISLYMQITVPNYPNYRLGRLVGSEADTVYNQPVSVAPVQQWEGVAVYPNPATDLVHIRLPDGSTDATLTMYDLSGKAVLTRRIGAVSEVDVEQLVQGVYIVVLTDDLGNTATIKLVLQ